ncbi:uracil-DNA glycosylase [Kamptonema cortianum]|nr:uracil-DNA glycosylase [Geitlerinema splendidum]MDK3161193.1 uracil-DNA glycosylase [Kamptonema cortianum]
MNADLNSLRIACCSCQDCELSKRRTQVVFGEGDPHAPLVLVGEGPGAQEDESGRPFVGKAGKMLDNAILDAGLTRDSLYICNTVKCRAADWATGKPKNRPPTKQEVAECRKWLVPQLSMISPEVILCIGGPSAKNLIDKSFMITKQRGLEFVSNLGVVAMATLHPSYIQRLQRPGFDGGYNLLVKDIKKAWELACDRKEARVKTCQ